MALGITTRALTSRDETEMAACLATLTATYAGTGFMHESFSKDDAGKFRRSGFAWANTLFGELILHVAREIGEILALGHACRALQALIDEMGAKRRFQPHLHLIKNNLKSFRAAHGT